MRYGRLAEFYARLEATAKRLEITRVLAELLTEADPTEIDKVVHLLLGEVAAPHEGVELGLADRLVVRSVAFATGLPEAEIDQAYVKTGDLGLAAEQAAERNRASRGGQQALFTEELTVARVFASFEKIARRGGAGSVEAKTKLLVDLLLSATPLEARYLVRFVAGKARLGVADLTVIDALAAMVALPDRVPRPVEELGPELRAKLQAADAAIERAYNVHPDLGHVARVLATDGLAAMEEIRMRPGVPVRPMLAERLSSTSEILVKMGGECLAEYKYDGLRLQAHLEAGSVELFSRRLERVTDQFPDVVEALRAAFRGTSAIAEGECVAVDAEGDIRPFQEVSVRRGRKHGLTEAIESAPVQLVLFDLLYLDGREVAGEPLPRRRERLESAFAPGERVTFSKAVLASEDEALEVFFRDAIAGGAEGILAKSVGPGSAYRAGARGWQWIKYKRDYRSELADSLDLVVVGAFAGRGRRAGWHGALLMACWNPEEGLFETVCKLGTGFDDATLAALPERLSPHRLPARDPRVKSALEADVWFRPAVVAEVVGAELSLSPTHTCAFGVVDAASGLAVRFPRFTGRWRADKLPDQATTTGEILALYRLQREAGPSGDGPKPPRPSQPG
ncbi:MAG TPA: ATP-dependent DNA ligase [Candidatus Thermoplasmatota archaeon]|nr:ATP-dependent DNA ligase [Candidatus Thermoplasmatota archaeon]